MGPALPLKELRVRWDTRTWQPCAALAEFDASGPAAAAAMQLHGFKFTPGWTGGPARPGCAQQPVGKKARPRACRTHGEVAGHWMDGAARMLVLEARSTLGTTTPLGSWTRPAWRFMASESRRRSSARSPRRRRGGEGLDKVNFEAMAQASKLRLQRLGACAAATV
mmetsp:Transcript_105222/g.329508  ORF Transcript_105222/g.329508 Transcript_105222/m.329508 type:complete len:166 (-) Transcript_105222:43-540(-)